MSKAVGTHIAKEIGVPLLGDAPKSGLAWGHFLQIQVDIDITKPLIRGKMIHIEDMEEEHFSLESQVHKKHILSTGSLSVSQSFVGGTFPLPRPPP
uniref:Uncharacterized protein n=1 Tax=Quercus lobata TaxID=97700 RepID=A0A7N2QX29_QUELO